MGIIWADYRFWQAKECQNHISDAIESISPVHAFFSDQQYLEVRPKIATKQMITQKVLQRFGISLGKIGPTMKKPHIPIIIGTNGPIGTPTPSVADVEPLKARLSTETVEVKSPVELTSKTNPFVIYIGEDRDDENVFNYLILVV